MSNNDQSVYQAPTAELHDEEIGVGEVKFFSPACRIGRARLVARNTVCYLILYVLIIALSFGVMTGSEGAIASFGLTIAPLFIGFIVISWIFAVQRLHDLDKSGWLSLLSLVPLVNIALTVYLLFAPGTQGANNYGPPPPPNRWYHWLGALGMPAIMLIGIIAAIALPAYQDYALRAQGL